MRSFVFGLAIVVGCSSTQVTPDAGVDAGPPLPARVCKTPADHALPWFTEVTDDVGLGKTATLEPFALTTIAADFDGDGYADLLSVAGGAQRGVPTTGTFAGKRGRFLLMNRPSSSDPKKRIFVDALTDSGLLTTRDGKGDRGFNLTNAADIDNDGDMDLILCSADPLSATYTPDDPCDAFLNDGKAHFTLAAASDLGKKVIWAGSGAFLDYDRDGVVDFWPATIAHWPYDPTGPNNEPPTLFRGNGDGTFVNVSAQVGLPTTDGTVAAGTQWRHVFGVTACDLDNDGDDDMLFADYGRQEAQVWRNDDGMFVNAAHDLGLDYDDRMDYSDDQSYRCYCAVYPGDCPSTVPAPLSSFCSAFGGNTGRGWVPGASDKPWSLGGNYFSFTCGDIDDDGDMDVMGSTIVHGDVGSAADPTELCINPGDGSKFMRPGNASNGLERPTKGIYWNHGDDNAVFVDVDLDGRKDIFTTTTGAYEATDHAHLFHQKADGTFEDITGAVGVMLDSTKPNHQGPAFVDIDGDGDLDLVAGDTITWTLRVWRNNAAQDQNWARIHIVGKGAGASNKSGIGAIVRVTAGGRTQTQYVSGGYGHGNVQADTVLTFGLGSACDIDKIEVRWPDKAATTTTYAPGRANYEIVIREGEPNAEYLPPR